MNLNVTQIDSEPVSNNVIKELEYNVRKKRKAGDILTSSDLKAKVYNVSKGNAHVSKHAHSKHRQNQTQIVFILTIQR